MYLYMYLDYQKSYGLGTKGLHKVMQDFKKKHRISGSLFDLDIHKVMQKFYHQQLDLLSPKTSSALMDGGLNPRTSQSWTEPKNLGPHNINPNTPNICMYMYICMYTRIHIYMYTYIHTYIDVLCACTYIARYTHTANMTPSLR